MSPVDRSRLPVPGPDRPFHFPRIARRLLANGLEVRAVTHSAVPVISIVLLVPGGSSADPADRHGLVSMTAGLLDEGSRGESALEVADRVARIGGDEFVIALASHSHLAAAQSLAERVVQDFKEPF